MIREVFLTILLSFLFGCVSQQQLIKPTQSGFPEGVFRGANLEDVKAKMMDGCMSKGLIVYESTTNQIVCGKVMEGSDAVIGQLIVGNSYSTTPERKVRFVLYKVGDDVKVTAQQWIETQMAFGQVRRQELKSNNQVNDIQNFLFSLGAE